VVTVAVDWLAIRNDYINGGGSYRKLAQKYNVPFSVLKDKAVKEKWRDAQIRNANEIRTMTEQKTQEKISNELSEEAAKKVKLRTGLLDLALKWLDSQDEGISDTGDFRRMVQSCIDLGIMDTQSEEQIEDDGLLAALGANAASLFDDGDDSGMLPEGKEE
jgi:hypothetical protein